MEKKRRGGIQRLDPDVVAFQKKAATNHSALTAKQRRERKRVRVMYDLLPEVKAAAEAIAAEQGTSASQAAAMLLTWAAVQYFSEGAESQEIKAAFDEGREPARTPRFEWNIVPSVAWSTILRERQG